MLGLRGDNVGLRSTEYMGLRLRVTGLVYMGLIRLRVIGLRKLCSLTSADRSKSKTKHFLQSLPQRIHVPK